TSFRTGNPGWSARQARNSGGYASRCRAAAPQRARAPSARPPSGKKSQRERPAGCDAARLHASVHRLELSADRVEGGWPHGLAVVVDDARLQLPGKHLRGLPEPGERSVRGPRDVELERHSARRKSAQTVDVQGRRLEIGQRANDPPGLIREPELAVRFVEPETRGLRNSGELRPRQGGRIADDMDGYPDVDVPAKAIEFPRSEARRVGKEWRIRVLA